MIDDWNQLKRVQSCTYLSVTYDFNMKWDVHKKNIVSKTKYLVHVFYRLKKTLIKKQMLQESITGYSKV